MGATLLALRWVFLVPIYEAPDEPTHLDYAFSIYSEGHLLNGRHLLVGGGVHPYTAYLGQVSRQPEIAFQPSVHVPPQYGTGAFYAGVDRGAPSLAGGWHPAFAPLLLAVYPFGYYALLALWIGFLHLFTHSLVAIFFGARIFSVLLLVCSLILSYGIVRELRLGRWLGVLLVGVIGFFPLTSFVASYIQPDNLSLTLVSLCLYAALVVRRRPDSLGMLAILGAGLGLLLVTKYQFYGCVLLPVLGMLIAERLFAPATRLTWKRLAACLAPPSLLLGLVQLWVVWGARAPYSAAIGSRSVNGEMNYAAAYEAWHRGLGFFLHFVVTGVHNAYIEYFHGGGSFISFLGQFGWLDAPLFFGSVDTTYHVRRWAADLTFVILVLSAVRLAQVSYRLLRLARRSRWRTAVRLATYNPLYNSLFLFTVFMVFLYVMTANTFGAQGRNWFPYILPMFLMGVVYAPKALPVRWAQRLFSQLVLVCLLLYAVFGSYYAVKSVTNRYYGAAPQVIVRSLS